ncbi:MAG: hypothetical protein WCJ94_02010 [bacterium]
MDKLIKIFLAGVLAGVILFLVASISYNYTGNISDPSIKEFFKEAFSMKLFYKLMFLNIGMGLIMAIFYSFMAKGMPGGHLLKGMFWGFTVWFILISQPLIMSLVAGTFKSDVIMLWLAQGLVSYVAAGLCIALVYKE